MQLQMNVLYLEQRLTNVPLNVLRSFHKGLVLQLSVCHSSWTVQIPVTTPQCLRFQYVVSLEGVFIPRAVADYMGQCCPVKLWHQSLSFLRRFPSTGRAGNMRRLRFRSVFVGYTFYP